MKLSLSHDRKASLNTKDLNIMKNGRAISILPPISESVDWFNQLTCRHFRTKWAVPIPCCWPPRSRHCDIYSQPLCLTFLRLYSASFATCRLSLPRSQYHQHRIHVAYVCSPCIVTTYCWLAAVAKVFSVYRLITMGDKVQFPLMMCISSVSLPADTL